MLNMRIQRKWKNIVVRLLACLEKAEQQALGPVDEKKEDDPLVVKFKEIETELKNSKTSFPSIMNWEANLMEGLTKLEQQMDEKDILEVGAKISDTLHSILGSVVSIKQLVEKGTKPSGGEEQKRSDEKDILEEGAEILKTLDFILGSVASIKKSLGESTKTSEGEQHKRSDYQQRLERDQLASKTFLKFEKCFDSLESYELKACYLCLSIFPENSIIKKKPLVYWWIGEGLITKTNGRTAEEIGEEVFEELITDGILIPELDHHYPSINSCRVHPLARRTLMFLAKGAHFFNFDPGWTKPVNGYGRAFLFPGNSSSDPGEMNQEISAECLTVFNLTKQYLQLGDLLSKLNNVQVLQLGRWQNDVKHHIEVENEDSTFDPQNKKNAEEVYLNGLGTQPSLRYLSLRGVSRMTSLPPAVANLSSLEILDLRDCQGLQKLAFDISSLENLTHLDVSECYLLESMPKGIEKLYALQVLKGFVIGNTKKDPCRVSDLVRLEQLRKLSIRIGNEASKEGHFTKFKDFKALKILVISWSGAEVSLDSFTVPPNLKKLELRRAPIQSAPNWLNPDQLGTLEKLYIRGGELSTLHGKYESHWRVKMLILKYLKEFKVAEEDLLDLFPEVEYLEKVDCHKDDRDILWQRKAQENKATTN